MKAGSLQRMTFSVLCESPRDRHPQEKCASKCVRGTFTLCLHLFFSTDTITIAVNLNFGGEIMTTCYFNRNIFDQIDKKRDITDDDLKVLREAVAKRKIDILVSFETVQETANAKQDTAVRGLKLISEISRAA